MPAMAPPDNEVECACGVGESDSEVATAAGAVTTEVMYFVVAAAGTDRICSVLFRLWFVCLAAVNCD